MKYQNFFCHVGNNPILARAIQEEVFSVGSGWASNKHRDLSSGERCLATYEETSCFSIQLNNNMYYGDLEHFKEKYSNDYEEVSISEFIKRVKENVEQKVYKVENLSYTVGENYIQVKAGTRIEKQDLIELARLINEQEYAANS